jgi:hypothetical protein
MTFEVMLAMCGVDRWRSVAERSCLRLNSLGNFTGKSAIYGFRRRCWKKAAPQAFA